MSIARYLMIGAVLLACYGGQAQRKTSARPEDQFVATQVLTPRKASNDLSFVGPVAQNLWTFNAVNMYEPEWKTEVFYVTSFALGGNPLETGQLIELDYLHHRARAWTMPIGIGAWNIIHGQDGNLYLGTYNGGSLLCFNPRTKQWIPLPQMPEDFRKREFIITDVVQAPDGDIYYGTFPGAHLLRYRPKDQTTTDLGRVADEMYVRWMAVTPKGVVLVGTGPRHGKVTAYDPVKGSFRVITPEQDQTPGVFSKPLVTGRYVVECQHQPGDRVLVYAPVTLELKHSFQVPGRNNGAGNQSAFTVIDDNHVLYQDDAQQLMSLNLTTGARTVLFAKPGTAANNRWYFDSKGNILGLLVQSYVYLDRRTQKVVHRTIPVPRVPQDVKWLSTAADGRIYGGPPLGQNLFSYDPAKRLLTSYDQVVDRTGEIYYSIDVDGKIYSIAYAEAGLSIFDPHRPWQPGEKPSSNPRAIAYLIGSKLQNRPVAGIHRGPMGLLYIGTQLDYGLLGGAISVFDPRSEHIDVYSKLIPEEEITALAADDRYVYAASDPQGGGGSAPTAKGSHFFVWDPQSKSIVFDHTFADDQQILSIAVVGGHAYFFKNDSIMDYDAARKTLSVLLHLGSGKAVPSESMRAARDGSVFGLFGNTVGRLYPSSHTIEYYDATKGKATQGLTIGLDGTVYFGSYTDMGMLHPKSPSPPLHSGQ